MGFKGLMGLMGLMGLTRLMGFVVVYGVFLGFSWGLPTSMPREYTFVSRD